MSEFVMLKNVRCIYPHLFVRPEFEGEEQKYSIKVMLDKDSQQDLIAKCKNKAKELLKEKNKGKPLPSEKHFFRDCEDLGKDVFQNCFVITASNGSKPLVIGTGPKDIITDKDECKIYSGCYVNVKIKPWYQDNRYGKRINTELIAVQFAKDGDALGGNYIDPNTAVEGFDEIEEEDEDWMSAE